MPAMIEMEVTRVKFLVLLIKLIETELHKLIKSLITFVIYTFIKLEKY